jgi:hypothetical protein
LYLLHVSNQMNPVLGGHSICIQNTINDWYKSDEILLDYWISILTETWENVMTNNEGASPSYSAVRRGHLYHSAAPFISFRHYFQAFKKFQNL